MPHTGKYAPHPRRWSPHPIQTTRRRGPKPGKTLDPGLPCFTGFAFLSAESETPKIRGTKLLDGGVEHVQAARPPTPLRSRSGGDLSVRCRAESGSQVTDPARGHALHGYDMMDQNPPWPTHRFIWKAPSVPAPRTSGTMPKPIDHNQRGEQVRAPHHVHVTAFGDTSTRLALTGPGDCTRCWPVPLSQPSPGMAGIPK